jgi:dihydroorotase
MEAAAGQIGRHDRWISPPDVAALRLETGRFGFTDIYGACMDGLRKSTCELAIRAGKVVYDLIGILRPE